MIVIIGIGIQMQTFLPYSDFKRSAQCLDTKRLGKQRVEALQILKALYIPDYGWANHPATKMWGDYPMALGLYMNVCIDEWISRGYNNTMSKATIDSDYLVMPAWLGNTRFHDSHKSNLLKKDYEFYKQFNWNITDSIPYYWNGYGKGE